MHYENLTQLNCSFMNLVKLYSAVANNIMRHGNTLAEVWFATSKPGVDVCYNPGQNIWHK